MKQMKLKIEKNWNAVCAVLKDKELQRNALIDAKRKYKKEKNKVEALQTKLDKIDEELLDLRNRKVLMEDEFDKLSKKMGYIRLRIYVLAEAIYDNLIEYQEFIKNECITDDTDVTESVQGTIDLIKKLPFECGDSDNDRFREVYNAIADAFIEKLKTIITGIFDQVMIELEKDEDSKIRK